MRRLVIRGFHAALLFAASVLPGGVFAQTAQSPKSRCEQLIDYFDYYGQSRGEGVNDGARNMDRIGAGVDCDRGDYARGIATMEKLLTGKKMGIPPPGGS